MVLGEVEQYVVDLEVEVNGIDQNNIIKTSGVAIGNNGVFSKNINANLLKVNSQIQIQRGALWIL